MTVQELYEKLSDLKRQASDLCDETIDERDSVSPKPYPDMSESEQDRYDELDEMMWALENCYRFIEDAMHAIGYLREKMK